MDSFVDRHTSLEAADPDKVIVTLFRGEFGQPRGWYIGPPSFTPEVPMDWHTTPKDNLLAQIALVRAAEIARKLGLAVCVVDPENLWNELF